jgi:cytosine/adenosine deaminase-related metal-dependent hydrolase
MPENHLYCKFGLIGENLELKQNVHLKFDGEGKIAKLDFEDIEAEINLNKTKENYVMIPGLINSHIHIGDSFAKERGQNKVLIEVVRPPNGIKHQLLRETPNTEKVRGIKCAIHEMISNGITCFIDFRENGIKGIDLLQNALKNEDIKCLIFGRFDKLDELKGVFNKSDGIGLSSYHQLSDDSKPELKRMKAFLNKKIACHVAELNHDSLLLNQIFDDEIVDIIVHGTQLKIDDLQKIQEKNIKIILCPRSNGYFGLGYPPIKSMLELGIQFSLGTDNVMVNNLSLFEEMRYLYYIARNQIMDKELKALNAHSILKMVTINAARNFNIDSNVGSISEGKSADLAIIDLNKPNFYVNSLDITGFFSLLLHRTNGVNIKQVFIGGNLIYENSK